MKQIFHKKEWLTPLLVLLFSIPFSGVISLFAQGANDDRAQSIADPESVRDRYHRLCEKMRYTKGSERLLFDELFPYHRHGDPHMAVPGIDGFPFREAFGKDEHSPLPQPAPRAGKGIQLYESLLPSMGGQLSKGVGKTTADTVIEAWVRHYASGLAPGSDNATAIAVDGVGNVYVTGHSSSTSPFGTDYYTVKYAPTGVELWSTRYDGGVDDIATAIAVDASGNVYVTGR
ncbi:MAG: hypothetical protein C4326_10845, partial [Ignavibacteria bacterium]